MDSSSLKLRGRTWFARLNVPKELQAKLGRKEFLRTLKTRDLKEANKRKHAVLAELHRELARLSETAAIPRDSAEFVLEAAKVERRAVTEGSKTEEQAEAAIDALSEQYIEAARRRTGFDPQTGEPVLTDSEVRALVHADRVVAGDDVVLLRESVRNYLGEAKERVRAHTLAKKKRALDAFAKWLKSDCEVSTITKKLAGRYVGEELTKHGHAVKTIKDTLGDLSAFWNWLEGRGLVDVNVWRGMSGTVKGSTRGTDKKRRAWQDDEVLKLLTTIPTDDPLWSLSAIAAYSGMRLDEIASLKVGDVSSDGAFTVREGKTSAAVRRVPVHPAIADLVTQLKRNSPDGWLIPGLLTGGIDGKRSHYVSKRFGTMRAKLGLDSSTTVFHSFRKAFAQRCEDAEVPESTIELIGGWSRGKRMSYGLYSPGAKFEVLRAAIAKATYGKADALVKKLGKSVNVATRSRRRHKRI